MARLTSGRGHAWLFEAKGIQRYIGDSGPLRDLIGASDLIAGLVASQGRDAIGAVVASLGLAGEIRYSRRAGGAFCLHAESREALERVRDLWRLTVGLHCPGLEFSDSGIVSGIDDLDAINNAFAALGGIRDNSAAELPPAGHPYAAFNPRTGRVVTRIYAHQGYSQLIPVDVLTAAHRRRAEALAAALDGDRVANKFLPPELVGKGYVFPRNLEREESGDLENNPLFPYLEQDQRIAVIHADLSGLGQIFRAATDPGPTNSQFRNADGVRGVATEIEKMIEAAAQAATREILLPAADRRVYVDDDNPDDKIVLCVFPARPILIGGDDISLITRADLAAPFAERLLIEIEQRSRAALAALKDWGLRVPEKLSACAGIAVIASGQPLQMASSLAESLCTFAKTYAKSDDPEGNHHRPHNSALGYPSYLAFHNGQSTLRENYDDIRAREMTVVDRVVAGLALSVFPAIRRSGNPYLVGAHDPDRASFAAVLTLARTLRGAARGRGKLRQMGREIARDPSAAAAVYRRWRQVLAEDYGDEERDVTAALAGAGFQDAHHEVLRTFNRPGETIDNLSPETRDAFARFLGPVLDALEWVDLGYGKPTPSEERAP